MLHSHKIRKAIQFALKTHEIDQKQKRKGKDIPYITHPLSVGVILACAGANEDTVIAGILHDTLEDSPPDTKVTAAMLKEEFGETVNSLVEDVTEPDKTASWDIRKQDALERIRNYPHDALLVKSADVLDNVSELLDDYKRDGEQVFSRFNVPKEKLIRHTLRTITRLVEQWPGNPLKEDLQRVAQELQL